MPRRVTVGHGRSRARSLGERRRVAREALVASGDAPALQTNFMLDGPLGLRRFYELALESGYGELASDSWPCEMLALGEVPNVVFRDGQEVVAILPDRSLAHVSLGHGWFHIYVAAPTAALAAGTCSAFRQEYPASYLIAGRDGRIPITFWTNGRYGPEPRLRKIDAAVWSEIERNYTAPVQAALADLMDWAEPPGTGQLILWQGPPGTGKSWALRALASEWSRWAEFSYITDPDSFFVKDPSYMVNVLLSDSYDRLEPDSGDVYKETDPLGKWRVLILEDTGELLAANAKESYGQGLSRLLNVVDGMIGQGLRVLALVTTNDELGDLHPAVARPGRCASQIEFGPLTAEEASAWLGETVSEGGTLADLYARSHAGAVAFAADDGDEPDEDDDSDLADIDSIDPDAQDALDDFWEENPDILAAATRNCGIDPTVDSLGYFRVGLAEPEHADIRAAVEATGVLTLALAEQWMDEERDQGGDDEAAQKLEYEALLQLARSPLPGFEAEALPNVETLVATLGARGFDVDEGERAMLASALETLQMTHRATVESVAAVMASAGKDRGGSRGDALALATLGVLREFASRPDPAQPDIHVHVPKHDLSVKVDAPTFSPQIDVHVPAAEPQPAPHVEVHMPEIEVHVPAQPAPIVNVAAASPADVHVHVPEQAKPRGIRVEYDEDGFKRFVPVDEEIGGDPAETVA